MKLSRRSILKALPALPLATKAAAAEAAGMVGASVVGSAGWSLRERIFGSSSAGIPDRDYHDRTLANIRKRLGAFIGGFPAFKLRRWRRDARRDRQLDADIAALKSISMGQRLRMQERATFERFQREEIERLQDNEGEQLWSKLMNFDDHDW